ncbi:MAG TPA: radical SAM protein [Bryobacteraceae bacterium]|nr:radical SAM protein [Bryobacteraceae bacterium]
MADVLLTHSNHVYYDRKQTQKMQPYPPLQTLLIAAILRQRGVDVALFDTSLNPPEEGFAAALHHHNPRVVAVCEDSFNFLTKMCLLRNRELAFWMAATAAQHGIPAAAHGPDAASHVSEYAEAGFELVVTGEAESVIPNWVLKRLRRPAAELMTINGRGTLDKLPFPAWDLVDVEQYRDAWLQTHGHFALNMVSSRGCPYRCNWCAEPACGPPYDVRPAAAVAEEMRRLKFDLRADRIWFADDIFGLSRKWALDFADEVESRNARLPFKMQSRCDLMTRDTVAALRRAGCDEVWIGVESGSQRILDAMEKGIRVEQVYQARENLRRHDIRACYFLQFGYPGEEWDDIQQTLRLVRETQPDDIGVSVCYPMPGTKLYDTVAAELGAKSNWSDSADLAMMFRGTYSSEFYRALARALHMEVRREAGADAAWIEVHQLENCATTVAAGVA